MKNKGQGLVELVVSIGVIMMVLAGTVSLIVFSMGKRNKSFDRNKAIRLSEVVIERLVETKKDDPQTFWQLNQVASGEVAGFDGYTYSLDFSPEDCGVNTCAKAVISIFWNGSDQGLQFSRFFAK